MPSNENQPVTRADLDRTAEAIRADLDRAAEAIRADISAAEQRTVEAMRDMQSEILRGLEAFARGNFARLHILDTRAHAAEDQLIATNDRITALEERVLMLETRRPQH